MFYGAYVLAKKGPLAKVWLAAHWDKKLTKAHVFETDVSATVEDIISPKVRMALRTSGHLLLGVVRIYSRKQKYLIHDLGEACAKIRMAFRPGIVDLPSEGGVVSTDAITLPEIFHDFETAVADLGSLDMEEQFTINRSRMAEITIAEDLTGGGGGAADPFSEFGEFGDEFGGGMEDIERARKAVTFEEEKDKTDRTTLQVTGDASSTLLAEKGGMEEEGLPDHNDFGGGNFLEDLGGLGGLEGLGEVPSVGDITMDTGHTRDDASSPPKPQAEEEPMEVDRQQEQQAEIGQHDQTSEQPGPLPPPGEDESGFVLEPVDVTLAADTTTKTKKRKRRLVVDEDKEFDSKSIRSQLEDFSDTLQPKLFPPPTKKAMMWKDMTTCEQLFMRPVFPFIAPDILRMVTRNYTSTIPDEPTEDSLLDLEQQEEGVVDANATRDTVGEVEKARGADVSEADSTIPGTGDAATINGEPVLDGVGNETTGVPLDGEDREFGLEDGGVEQRGEFPPGEEPPPDELAASRVIPDMPELEGLSTDDAASQATSDDKHSGEMSEEFEKHRWTKRTQQVLKMLDRSLTNSPDTPFSALTQKCSRKQAASRFYTCLLLAKENTIHVQQTTAYGEILITKGPKFTKAF
jgi:cohesin complex subunit SCC1